MQVCALVVSADPQISYSTKKLVDRHSTLIYVKPDNSTILDQVANVSPDVVAIYDINLWLNTQIISFIQTLSPRTKVICFVNSSYEAVRAILLGATSYEYVSDVFDLSNVLRDALQNRIILDNDVANIILSLIRSNHTIRRTLFLSEEEYKILQSISQKADYKTIESKFNIQKGSLPRLLGVIILKLANSSKSVSNNDMKNYLLNIGVWKIHKVEDHITDSAMRRLFIKSTQELRRVISMITSPKPIMKRSDKFTRNR